ncbi:MAG: LysR family transcriptional regulator [Betaproteobacteria bacterium]|nr:LysR family transcriptional regulator [Betaproteobacteria bacterium]
MELYQLRSFAVVAELGHLTRASEKLHLSQPALSAQIKALEDELGMALFDRTSSGMTLTAAGRRLLPEAERVVGAARALKSAARLIRGEVGGLVRVGTLADPEFIRVAEFLRLAVSRFPGLEIELQHEVSGAAFEKVRDGTLDASFYYGDLVHAAVGSRTLREIAYRIAAPAAWRSEVEGAGWSEIVALPWVMAPAISTHHALATEWFRSRGLAPTKRIEADNDVVISALVVGGLGVALMREDLAIAAEAAGEVCLWPDARLATRLQFVFRAERARDPVLQGLLQVLDEMWPGSPPPPGDATDPGEAASTAA